MKLSSIIGWAVLAGALIGFFLWTRMVKRALKRQDEEMRQALKERDV